MEETREGRYRNIAMGIDEQRNSLVLSLKGAERSGSVNYREARTVEKRAKRGGTAQCRREKEKDAKIRKKAQGDVREPMDWFSSW
jgi:hypothetical protein